MRVGQDEDEDEGEARLEPSLRPRLCPARARHPRRCHPWPPARRAALPAISQAGELAAGHLRVALFASGLSLHQLVSDAGLLEWQVCHQL